MDRKHHYRIVNRWTGNLGTGTSSYSAYSRAHELSGATIIVVTHDSAVAEALPRALAISHGVIASEGRGGRRFAVVNRDGTVQLPAEVGLRWGAAKAFVHKRRHQPSRPPGGNR